MKFLTLLLIAFLSMTARADMKISAMPSLAFGAFATNDLLLMVDTSASMEKKTTIGDFDGRYVLQTQYASLFDTRLASKTTANLTEAADKRYVTDANLVVIGNTSGTNTGDQTLSDVLISPITNNIFNKAPTSDDVYDGLALKLQTDFTTLTSLAGTNWDAADIIAVWDDSAGDIRGTTVATLDQRYYSGVGVLLLDDPGFMFKNDTGVDTGCYWVSDGIARCKANGQDVFEFTQNAFSVFKPMLVDTINDSANLPSISVNNRILYDIGGVQRIDYSNGVLSQNWSTDTDLTVGRDLFLHGGTVNIDPTVVSVPNNNGETSININPIVHSLVGNAGYIGVGISGTIGDVSIGTGAVQGLLINPTVPNNVIYNGIFSSTANVAGGTKYAGNFDGDVNISGKLILGNMDVVSDNLQPYTDQGFQTSGQFHVLSGFPVTNVGAGTPPFFPLGYLGAGSSMLIEDDVDLDFTGADIGTNFVMVLPQIAVASGKTNHQHTSLFMGAASSPSLTGGQIDKFSVFRGIGVLSNGGDFTIPDSAVFRVDGFADFAMGTDRWGVKDESTLLENHLNKLAVNTVNRKVAPGMNFNVLGNSLLDGAATVTGQLQFDSLASLDTFFNYTASVLSAPEIRASSSVKLMTVDGLSNPTFVGLFAPNLVPTNLYFIFPSNEGLPGECLKTDGGIAGTTLSWGACGGGGSSPTFAASQVVDFTAACGKIYPIGASINVQLPPPVADCEITIKNTASFTITILQDGAEPIEGVNASYIFSDNLRATRLKADSTGTNWYII